MNQEALIEIAKRQYAIDVPIMSTRVAGRRLEIYLYGGRRIIVEPDEAGSDEAGSDEVDMTVDLALRLLELSYVRLRALATHFAIAGRSGMDKVALAQALAQIDPAGLAKMIDREDEPNL